MGRAIKGQGAWDLVKQGLVMVPEGRGVFSRMTITENLQMGAFVRDDKEIDADVDKVFGIFPRLKERAKQLAGTMSGGEQQMLAMGRALMARPKVLLMDEPSMGLSPIMVDKIFEVVADIHKQGTTILLVEQNASRALALADRGYVMESGEITMRARPRACWPTRGCARPTSASRLEVRAGISRRLRRTGGDARWHHRGLARGRSAPAAA